MATWNFEVLGGVSVRSEARILSDLVGKKTGALLALLALSPGRTRPREEVIDLLWPEVAYDEARVRFRQVLARLRRLLEPETHDFGTVLIADRSQIGIAAPHQSDVALLLQHLRSAATAAEPALRARHLRAALALYRGEFAPGFYIDALLTERERLAALAESARERLEALERAGAAEAQIVVTSSNPVISHPRNRFFGRETERERLVRLLEENTLVTLLGPGGTGKTRLTQELQAEVPHSHFVSLSALRQGERIPEIIATSLALPESSETALNRIQVALIGKKTFLVLDNFEQLVESGGPEAVSRLLTHVPDLRLLVTSRLKLNLPQECVTVLAPLPENDAASLFTDRARLARADFSPSVEDSAMIAELCQRLDGLPLAIELAAARVAVLSPGQILERLSRRFDLLTDKRRDREERHTSLRAALDWGWGLLAPDVQRFFAQLSLFRGSFSLEAVEAVTQEPLAIDSLQSLVDASLLVAEPGAEGTRFRLLETLREYGAEKLNLAECESLSRRHADFFLQRAREWRPLIDGAEFLLAISRFRREQDNFIAAIERMTLSDPSRAVALCIYIARFWRCAYWDRPALGYFRQALKAGEQAGVGEGELALLHSMLGAVYRQVGDYPQAHASYQVFRRYNQAELERKLSAGEREEALMPLRRNIARVLYNIGGLYYDEDQLEESYQCHLEAVIQSEHLENEIWKSRNLHGISIVLTKKGVFAAGEERADFFEQARHYAEQGTRLCRSVRDDYFLCHLLHVQTYILPLLGERETALTLLHEGFTLACALEHRMFVVNFLHRCYDQAVYKSYWETAAQLYGGTQGLNHRWGYKFDFDTNDSHLYPRVDLPVLLGSERYEALYQMGFEASLETLQAIVLTITQKSSSISR